MGENGEGSGEGSGEGKWGPYWGKKRVGGVSTSDGLFLAVLPVDGRASTVTHYLSMLVSACQCVSVPVSTRPSHALADTCSAAALETEPRGVSSRFVVERKQSMSKPHSAFLTAEHIVKDFGAHRVLDDVSISVSSGDVVSIIGPSGAGKSTLLRCMNLLETPTSGTLEIGDFRIAIGPGHKEATRKELSTLRRNVGMVFQNFNLFPHLTVTENISLAQRRVLGRSKADARERAAEILARMGLSDKADEFPNRCSGGQQQRVAIARSLSLDPQVMLFDEPTSALDPEVGAEILAVMRELADEGMTMMVVTHEMGFAREVADRLYVMVDGAIVESGQPQALMSDPQHPRTQQFLGAVLGR